jgi:hypothetical protein
MRKTNIICALSYAESWPKGKMSNISAKLGLFGGGNLSRRRAWTESVKWEWIWSKYFIGLYESEC